MPPLNRKEISERFRRGIVLKRQNELSAALELFQELELEGQHLPSIYAQIAEILELQGYSDRALETWKRVVQLSPESELASLALFHAYWNAGNRLSAFQEMKRFCSIVQSDKYEELIRDLNEELDLDLKI